MKKEVNNLIINYEVRGKGENLIMLHGNEEDLSIFNELAKKLENHFKIYMIDTRNHGKSDVGDDINYEIIADDLYKFIVDEKIANINVLGFSDGAIAALIAEINHPGLFKKMILCGVNLSPDDFIESIYNETVKEAYESNNPLVFMMIEGPDIKDSDLLKIRANTTFIFGEYDIFKKSMYKRIKSVLLDSKQYIIKNEDHGSYIIHNDKIFKKIMNILNKV